MTTDAEDRSTWLRNGQIIRPPGRRYYQPGDLGWEKRIKEWMDRLRRRSSEIGGPGEIK